MNSRSTRFRFLLCIVLVSLKAKPIWSLDFLMIRHLISDAPQTPPTPQDSIVQERVERFLAASNIPALRRLSVSVEGDVVSLNGEVSTFYEKQMAVQFTSRVAGVVRIVDRINVRAYEPLRAGLHSAGRPRLATPGVYAG